MSENEILSLLSKFNVETLLLAILVCVFTQTLKKHLPSTLKNLTPLTPFVLGVAVYAGYSFLVLKSLNASLFITKGVQTGGVAVLIYALLKQISRKSSNCKNAVTDILTGFVDESSISGTVNRVIKEYSLNQNGASALKTINKIVSENSNVTEAECVTLSNLIVKTLDALTKSTANNTTK